MAPNPIATLKKGLVEFSKKIKARKDKLIDKLVKNEISDDDEHWLDHEANTVDEQRVLDALEAASDYNLTETSDREICNAVMEAIDACETMEINGGDDVDEDFPAEPSQQDILKVTSTLTKFVDKMDDPLHASLKGFYAL